MYLRQSNRLAFLFSPQRLTLKNRPEECPKSYHPHPNRIKLLSSSNFSESTCARTAVALCEGVSPPIFDTVRNLLQINACLLHYSRQFLPSRNPHQTRFEPPSLELFDILQKESILNTKSMYLGFCIFAYCGIDVSLVGTINLSLLLMQMEVFMKIKISLVEVWADMMVRPASECI